MFKLQLGRWEVPWYEGSNGTLSTFLWHNKVISCNKSHVKRVRFKFQFLLQLWQHDLLSWRVQSGHWHHLSGSKFIHMLFKFKLARKFRVMEILSFTLKIIFSSNRIKIQRTQVYCHTFLSKLTIKPCSFQKTLIVIKLFPARFAIWINLNL